jgi:hypothetical protein
MIEILHFEHPDWSIRTICRVIRHENDGLRNFGESTIYKHLSNNNKALLDLTKSQNRQGKTKTKLQNNVTEPFVLSREQKVIEGSSSRSRQVAGIDDKKVIEKSSSYTPNPEFERFRQEKGKVVEPSDEDDVIKIPDEQREQDQVIYQDTETVRIDLEKLTREYNELETKYDQIIVPYEVHCTIVVKGQDIPLTIKVDPYKRTAMPELDQKEAKKLKWF